MHGVWRPRGKRPALAMSGRQLLPSARQDAVGFPDNKVFEAQYPACTFPCQRFGDDLAIVPA
jgi:hypothetical protein